LSLVKLFNFLLQWHSIRIGAGTSDILLSWAALIFQLFIAVHYFESIASFLTHSTLTWRVVPTFYSTFSAVDTWYVNTKELNKNKN
jgi:hypothetical protein